MPDTLTNAHDKFIQETFKSKENARSFIETYLPSELVEQFDLDTLEISKDSFIDGELSEYYSDVLYKIGLINHPSAYLYLLLDHKSYVDPLVSFQLLVYSVRIWELALKQQRAIRKEQPRGQKTPLSLPPIIPLVLYHGEERWQVSTEFAALFDMPEVLRPYIPNYNSWLCDLSDYSDAEIKGYLILQVRLLLLKYIFDKEFGRRLPQILQLLRQLESKQTALEQLEVIIRYVWSGAKHLTETELQQAVDEVFAKGEDTMPTLAEKYIEIGWVKGREEGIEQGREKERAEAERKMWQRAFKNIRQTLAIRFETSLEQYDHRLKGLALPAMETLNDLAFQVPTLTVFEAELTALETPPPDEASPLSDA